MEEQNNPELKRGHSSLFNKIMLVISLLVSTGLAAWLLTGVDWEVAFGLFDQLSFSEISLSTLFITIYMVLTALRWNFLIRNESDQKTNQICTNFFIGNFLSAFTPGAVGSDAYRIYTLGSMGCNRWRISGQIVKERFVGLVSFLLFMFIPSILLLYSFVDRPAIFPSAWISSAAIYSGILILAACFTYLLLFELPWAVPNLISRLGISQSSTTVQFSEYLEKIRAGAQFKKGREAIIAFGFSAAILFMWTAAAQVLNASFDANIPIVYLCLLLSFTELSRFIPTSIQGIGVRETVFVFGAGLIGTPEENALYIVVLIYIINTFVQVLLAIISYFIQNFYQR